MKLLCDYIQGGPKVGLQLRGYKTQNLFLYYDLLIIVLFSIWKTVFAPPYIAAQRMNPWFENQIDSLNSAIPQPLYDVDGIENCWSHYGKQYGSYSKKLKVELLYDQQFHLWVFIQRNSKY